MKHFVEIERLSLASSSIWLWRVLADDGCIVRTGTSPTQEIAAVDSGLHTELVDTRAMSEDAKGDYEAACAARALRDSAEERRGATGYVIVGGGSGGGGSSVHVSAGGSGTFDPNWLKEK